MAAGRTKRVTCDGKRRHRSREAADRHIDHLVRDRGAAPGALESYRCQWCGWWHVGHRVGMRSTGRR